jgi:hypothetical protein
MPGNGNGVDEWTPEEWQSLMEMEAVLNCTTLLTTQAQHKTKFTGAYGSLIQATLLATLRAKTLEVIDLRGVTQSSKCLGETSQ